MKNEKINALTERVINTEEAINELEIRMSAIDQLLDDLFGGHTANPDAKSPRKRRWETEQGILREEAPEPPDTFIHVTEDPADDPYSDYTADDIDEIFRDAEEAEAIRAAYEYDEMVNQVLQDEYEAECEASRHQHKKPHECDATYTEDEYEAEYEAGWLE